MMRSELQIEALAEADKLTKMLHWRPGVSSVTSSIHSRQLDQEARRVQALCARVVKNGKDASDPKTCHRAALAFLSAHSALSIASSGIQLGRKDTPHGELTVGHRDSTLHLHSSHRPPAGPRLTLDTARQRRNSAAMRNAAKESDRQREAREFLAQQIQRYDTARLKKLLELEFLYDTNMNRSTIHRRHTTGPSYTKQGRV